MHFELTVQTPPHLPHCRHFHLDQLTSLVQQLRLVLVAAGRQGSFESSATVLEAAARAWAF